MTKCDLKSTKNGLKEKSIKSLHFESIVSKRYIDFVCDTNNRICTLLLENSEDYAFDVCIAFSLAVSRQGNKTYNFLTMMMMQQ